MLSCLSSATPSKQVVATVRFGYRRLHVLLSRSGEHVNHKRVHRVYREAGLMIRRKKRKHCVRVGQPLRAWTAANQEWALDFLHDDHKCYRVTPASGIGPF
jgi:hypothetical protein